VSARITQNMLSRSLLLDLQNVTDKLSRTQRKISRLERFTMAAEAGFVFASSSHVLQYKIPFPVR